jgi:hypothetical protein
MWALENQTPYAAGRNWTRDKQGVHVWVVAVKATFDFAAGGPLKLADEQIPPLLEPEYRGKPGISSLLLDSDLLAPKPGTDILLDGSAHAPKERPAPSIPVSLRIGKLEKQLIVHGPRVYYQGAMGLTTTAPRPFVTQPIHYEWAFGGSDLEDPDPRRQRIDERNPVGKGFAVDKRRLERQPAHVVEYPRGDPAKVGPAGFGPVASYWSPRREHGGTYDARWEKSRKPLLPADYDERFALSAPEDQRLPGPLRGGEVVTLLNLTPEGAVRFELPRIQLAFRTRFGKRTTDHQGMMTTVFIDAEKRKLSLVWQSTLRVMPKQFDYLDATAISEVRAPA